MKKHNPLRPPALTALVAIVPLLLPTIPLPASAATPPAVTTVTTVTIDAGDFERENVAVMFLLPPNAPRPGALRRQNTQLPLQIDRPGMAAVTIPRLAKGERARFELVPAPAAPDRVRVQRDGTRLNFGRVNGNGTTPLFSYQAEPGELPRSNIPDSFRRGGYLHPIHAPGGQVVTDDFPPNHVHHHGVWWAWTSTVFQGRHPDFWNMGDRKGRVEFVAVDDSWSGPVHAGLRARHRFVDLLAQPPVVALTERWTVTAYAQSADASGTWFFDLTSEQECATGDALHLPQYRYGGIGLRGNWAWNGPTNVHFLTADGETDRQRGNGSRSRWCDMSGDVDGRRVGIAVLCHPSNYRFPQPMRLHPDEPFFNYAPSQAGEMELKPGTNYLSRYRFVLHDGPPPAAVIERLWNDFAHPPRVTVE